VKLIIHMVSLKNNCTGRKYFMDSLFVTLLSQGTDYGISGENLKAVAGNRFRSCRRAVR
jgi:hypothetical protein